MKFIIKHIVLFLLVTLLFSNKIMGQSNALSSYYLNKEVGNENSSKTYLSTNIVTAISQDDDGMMWFGTKRGLNSFDSYNFEEYNQVDGIINATITDIQPVGDTLFIGTEKGLCIYDVKNKKATNFFTETDSIILPDDYIYYITQPINNRLTICTKRGTTVYDLITKEFYVPKINNYFPNYEVRYIEHMPKYDIWWVATSNGLVSYQDDNQSLRHYHSIDDIDNTLPNNSLRCMYSVDEDRIFIGTANGLALLDVSNREIKRIDLNILTNYYSSRIDISKIISISEEEIMISTYSDGLYIYNHKDETALHISKFDRRYTISENYIYDIFKDDNEIIWIATFNGLNRFENNLAKFHTISIFEKGLMLSITYFLELHDNNILVGTESGVKIFNADDESIKDFKTFFNAKEDYFESLYVYSFYLHSGNRLWVGTRNSGLYIYDIDKDIIIDVAKEYEIDNIDHAVVREITCDEFENMWIATNMGLYCINLISKETHCYVNDRKDNTSIPNDDVYDLMLADGLLYVTTGDGLATYNYDTDNFVTYRLPDSFTKDDVVKNNGLFDIVAGGDGRYYIGSYSSGMLALSPDTKTFKTSKREDSFGTMIYSIIPDDNGFLWASTSKGIMKYDLATKEISLYDENDGLQGNEFTPNAFLRSKKGQIFFGGFKGFNYFYPDEIRLETKIPKVVVTSLRTNNDIKHRYLKDGDTINLSYNENSFEIGFSTLNLVRKSMVQYSCMLDNYDDKWSFYDSKHRYVDYHRLRPGTYVFNLKAANEVNIWNEEPLRLTIIIHPAWYQRGIFIVSVVLLLMILFLILFYQRSKIIYQKREQRRMVAELETQMAQLKQKTLQLQMNPHVIFNTLNSIQQYIINQDIDNAVRYLSSFSRLMRRILNNSNERFISLSDELEAVNLYLELESMRLGNKFRYNVTVADDIDVDNVEIAPLIIQPFVENAIIHGLVPKKDDCLLEITLSKMGDNKLLCVIEDNGVGRKLSERLKVTSGGAHKSYGMSITKRRLEMMSKISNGDFSVDVIDLYDDKGVATGTRVNITITYQD